LDINQENINAPDKIEWLSIIIFYFNTSYNGRFGSGWQLVSGLSYGYSKNQIGLNLDNVNNDENCMKLKLKKNFSNYFKLSFGSDYFSNQI
jgi:hypothetical protein